MEMELYKVSKIQKNRCLHFIGCSMPDAYHVYQSVILKSKEVMKQKDKKEP